jgi:hypothetical protein
MATATQGDPRDAIFAHLASRLQLTDGAQQLIQGLLSDVDLSRLQTPADLAQAFAEMDRLAAHISGRRTFTGSVDAQSIQMSLRDLCPLFPICWGSAFMAIDEQTKLAFASVSDLTKQLITLGTGVLTLEVGFAKVFFEKAVTSHWQVQVSWIALMLSISAGVWVLMALAGKLAKTASVAAEDVYVASIRLPAFIQVLAFVIGMFYTAWFGLMVT